MPAAPEVELPERRVDHREPLDLVGVVERKTEGHAAAPVVPNNASAGNPCGVHERGNRARERRRVVGRRARAAAVTGKVGRQHAVAAPREEGDGAEPVVRRDAQAVQEDDRPLGVGALWIHKQLQATEIALAVEVKLRGRG